MKKARRFRRKTLLDEASRTGDLLGGKVLRTVDGGDITS
jgi:hypothetical protein